jgi:hypothetical protein
MVMLAASFEFLQAPSPRVEFVTVETLFTAAGATTAVITVTSVLHGLIPNLPARWFALGFSLALTFIGINAQSQPWTFLTVLLAVINALVIYAAAVGVNNVLTKGPGAGAAVGRSFRWFP